MPGARPPVRRLGRWLGRGLLAVILVAAAGGAIYHQEIRRLWVVNTLFDADRIVANFSGMQDAFNAVALDRGDGPVTPLPEGPSLHLPAAVADWVEAADVTGLVVLDRGRIVHAAAYLGTGMDDLRISWSMAKSVVSVLVGTALERGEIAALDDPVTRYAPRMAGTAYDGTTVRDLLQMETGVTFHEDVTDPGSDINRMGRVLALGGSMDGFAMALEGRDRPPGQAWEYTSIDTHVLAMVLRGATGESLATLLSERIVQPLGLEAAPVLLTDGEGVGFALGGLNMTLRDYARFGLMVSQDGRIGDRQVVSADWIARSTSASAHTAPGATGFGYHWWIPRDPRPGEVMARGLYGQYLYVYRARDVVIVVTAANRAFSDDAAHPAAMAALRATADAVVAGR